ncbi:MAG: hypothetical protein ABJC09_06795 [Terriglobia bacterium]
MPAPIAVRYAWDNYPDTANLYNGADLPAGPFRTDSWDTLSVIAQQFTAKQDHFRMGKKLAVSPNPTAGARSY